MDRTEKLSIEQKSAIDIFVAKIYDYALINSFWGFPRFIDSPTSYATLLLCYIKFSVLEAFEYRQLSFYLLEQ